MINERRYKSRPLVSAGVLFRVDRPLMNGAGILKIRPTCAAPRRRIGLLRVLRNTSIDNERGTMGSSRAIVSVD